VGDTRTEELEGEGNRGGGEVNRQREGTSGRKQHGVGSSHKKNKGRGSQDSKGKNCCRSSKQRGGEKKEEKKKGTKQNRYI